MRFFAVISVEVYEQIRATLDDGFTLPNDLGTVTAINPASFAPRDDQGYLLVAVSTALCDLEPAATLIPQWLASGDVIEIDHDTYQTYITAPEPVEP